MNSKKQEIRQYKFEKYKAELEENKRLFTLFFWIFVPSFITTIIALRNEISQIFSGAILEFFNLLPNNEIKLLFLALILFCLPLLAVILAMLFTRIVASIEQSYKGKYTEFQNKLDKLIEEVEKE